MARKIKAVTPVKKPRAKDNPAFPSTFEMLLIDISTRLISHPADLVDSEIIFAQRQVCEHLGLDISVLWQRLPENPDSLTMTHIFLPADFPVPVPAMDGREMLPWSLETTFKNEIVKMARLTDHPAAAARDVETLRQFGVKSVLGIPLSVGGGPVFGAVSFNTIRKEQVWSTDLVDKLRLVAQIFANALARKRIDQALRESEARYRGIFEESIEGIFRTSPEGRVMVANPALAKMLGYDSAEDLLMSIRDVGTQIWSSQEERSRFIRQLDEKGMALGYECRFRRKDGTLIWVSLSTQPVRGPDGQLAYADGFVEDINERKRTKEALTESEKRYRTLFESAPAGIIFIGTDGYVRTANSLQASLYGYDSPQQLEGFYAPLFVAEKDRERSARNMRDLLQGKELGDRTYTAVRRDGSEFMVEVTSVTVYGPRQEVQGYLCLTRDITKDKQGENERIQLRQELAHLARVMGMAELATSLAHEINQPLGAILNNAEAARSLLSQGKEKQREIGEIIEDIIQDAQRAGDVVRKIRGLVKKGEANFEPLSLNTLIEDVLRLVNNSLSLNKVTLRLDLKPDLASIRGDRVRLQQVLLNLMTNALDAMKQRPSRILEVRSSAPATDTVAVTIGDSGTGIFEAGKENVFKPFYTTKKDGLGMGLAISRSIIEEHGGRIWGENNPAGGATFSFSLKAWREKEVLD